VKTVGNTCASSCVYANYLIFFYLILSFFFLLFVIFCVFIFANCLLFINIPFNFIYYFWRTNSKY